MVTEESRPNSYLSPGPWDEDCYEMGFKDALNNKDNRCPTYFCQRAAGLYNIGYEEGKIKRG